MYNVYYISMFAIYRNYLIYRSQLISNKLSIKNFRTKHLSHWLEGMLTVEKVVNCFVTRGLTFGIQNVNRQSLSVIHEVASQLTGF
jgi:hypothetical protein